jgi:hypothetical protein
VRLTYELGASFGFFLPRGGVVILSTGEESFSLKESSRGSSQELLAPGCRRSLVNRSRAPAHFLCAEVCSNSAENGLWLFRIFSVSALMRCGRSAYVLEIIGALVRT